MTTYNEDRQQQEARLNVIIPFVSHVEKKLSPDQAMAIAQILGLPMEIGFLSLTIDETLTMKAFARGVSQEQPFHPSSVPFNFLAYQVPEPPPAPEPEPIPDTPPDSQPTAEPIPDDDPISLNEDRDPNTDKSQLSLKCSICGKLLGDAALQSNNVDGLFCSTKCLDYAEEYPAASDVKSLSPTIDDTEFLALRSYHPDNPSGIKASDVYDRIAEMANSEESSEITE